MNLSLLPDLILPYWTRLLLIMLAAGAAAYAAGAVAATLGAPVLLRRIRGWQQRTPERAGGLALTLRLLPLAAAALASVALCLPSYMWLEPHGHAEAMSAVCLALALAGGIGLGVILLRAARVIAASRRYERLALRTGAMREIAGQPVRVLPGAAPSMAIAGVWRPVLMISQAAHARLSREQLALGFGHEQAHRSAHDNLKRLLLAVTPVAGPRARALEQAWARMAEWAADDRAVAGDAQRSLTLASTLVAVAKLNAGGRTCGHLAPLVSTLEYGGGQELSERIARLLAFESTPAAPRPQRRWIGYAVATAVIWCALQPTTLLAAHAVLERLVR